MKQLRKCEKNKIDEMAFYKDPLVWIILLFIGISMGVILKSGFYMDDTVLSYNSKHFIWNTGTDLRTYFSEEIHNWLLQGRFFPVSNIYVSALMYYINSAFVYKLWILAFIVLDVYVFGFFVRRLTGSRRFSLLVMVMLSICFQIRTYHDGLISYHLLMQIELLLLLLSGITLQQYLWTEKRRWLVFSLVLYTTGLLTYELAYLYILILGFLVLFYGAKDFRSVFRFRNIKRTFFIILPYFLVMLSLFFFNSLDKKCCRDCLV